MFNFFKRKPPSFVEVTESLSDVKHALLYEKLKELLTTMEFFIRTGNKEGAKRVWKRLLIIAKTQKQQGRSYKGF